MRLPRILPVYLVAAAASAAPALLPDFLPPGTKVVIGISLRNIANSPLLASFGGDAKGMTTSFLSGGALAGIDPFKDVDDLLLTSTGEGQNPPSLIVMHGRFNLDRVGARASRYHGVVVADDPAHGGGTVAFLDAGTAIAGEPELVRAAIDRRGKGAELPAALAEQVQSLSERCDVWGVGDLPEGANWDSAKGSGAESLDRFEFGASFRQDFALEGQIHLRAGKDVEKMMGWAKMLEAAMKQPQAQSTGGKIDLAVKDGTIKLSLVVPEAEWKKAIATQKARLASSFQAAVPTMSADPRPAVQYSKPGNSHDSTIKKNSQGDAVTVKLPGAK